MMIFSKSKTIECPCCKAKLIAPLENSVSRCNSCQSDIVATYGLVTKVQNKVSSVLTASIFISLFLRIFLDIDPSLGLLLYLVVLIALCILFRIPFKTRLNDERAITYSYLSGYSYPELQTRKHKELLEWLDKAMKDVVGFSRYIVKSDYVAKVIDSESFDFFELFTMRTELLPSESQINDWREEYLAGDLVKLEGLREEYEIQFRGYISELKKLADQVEYFCN